MSLVSMLSPNGPSGFGNHSTAEEVSAGLALGGKTYLVTGCNSGLGMETLRVLALRGARVVGAARTAEKARATAHALGLSDKVIPLAVELSDPASVRAAVAQVKAQGLRLDGVICNAGIMALPKLAQDRRSREALEELLLDPDPYLRVDVVRALGEVGDGKARPALRASLETDLDPRVRRRIREVLRDLGESGKRATDQLKEELDKLLAEQADLKARLSKLEASQAPVKTGSVKKKKKR